MMTKKIHNYFSRHLEVMAVYLFGSQAKGNARKSSDVDIAILLAKGYDSLQSFQLRLQFMKDLESIYGKEVDVVILNQAKPLLQHQVLKYGRLLYEKNRRARIEFEVNSRKQYFDIKPVLDRQSRALFKQIKEVGLSGRYRGHRDSLEDVRRLHGRLEALSETER